MIDTIGTQLVSIPEKGTDLRKGGVGVEIKNERKDVGVRVLRIGNGTEIGLTETDAVDMIITKEVSAPAVIGTRLLVRNRPVVTQQCLNAEGVTLLIAETKTLRRVGNGGKAEVIVANVSEVIATTTAPTNWMPLSLNLKMERTMVSMPTVMDMKTSPSRAGSVTIVTLHLMINSLLRITVNPLMSHTIPKRSCIPLKLNQTSIPIILNILMHSNHETNQI